MNNEARHQAQTQGYIDTYGSQAELPHDLVNAMEREGKNTLCSYVSIALLVVKYNEDNRTHYNPDGIARRFFNT